MSRTMTAYHQIASPFCTVVCFSSKHTATAEIYTLSLHDALPISQTHGKTERTNHPERNRLTVQQPAGEAGRCLKSMPERMSDRKSTRLNSSHRCISYAVFCLKKKNINRNANTCLRLSTKPSRQIT